MRVIVYITKTIGEGYGLGLFRSTDGTIQLLHIFNKNLVKGRSLLFAHVLSGQNSKRKYLYSCRESNFRSLCRI